MDQPTNGPILLSQYVPIILSISKKRRGCMLLKLKTAVWWCQDYSEARKNVFAEKVHKSHL